jgi:hypothetical protein
VLRSVLLTARDGIADRVNEFSNIQARRRNRSMSHSGEAVPLEAVPLKDA